ncbi:hypothetical protein [Enterococcus cecorum]|uniref:hypothetical protein n=1 Tax=Enterococcus cecorum TaxID=44008 RepID=UPI0038B3BE2C
MILKWKIAFSYLAFSTWEVISWEEITKDKHCYITVKKIIPHRKGLCTKNRVEFYRNKSNKLRKAQTGFYAYLGFFDFLEFLALTLPIPYLPFVLMTERGRKRLSPPFDKREEVRT